MSKKLVQPSASVFVSVPEAVKVTGYSRNHIYNLVTKKKIKFQEEGHKILVSLEDIKKRADENKSRIKKFRGRKGSSTTSMGSTSDTITRLPWCESTGATMTSTSSRSSMRATSPRPTSSTSSATWASRCTSPLWLTTLALKSLPR